MYDAMCYCVDVDCEIPLIYSDTLTHKHIGITFSDKRENAVTSGNSALLQYSLF